VELNLLSLPDDVLPMVLTRIDDAQAAARALAAWGSARAAVPLPPEHGWGPSTPVISQVQILSAFLRSPRYHRRHNRGLELAAQHGWVGLLPWLVGHGERWGEETTLREALHNRFRVIEWGLSQGAPWGLTCKGAARGGHLALLRWARAQSPPAPWDSSTCHGAARGGHLGLLQWARAQTPPAPWDASTCSGAASGGHLELLKWARLQSPPAPWGRTCWAAAGGGNLELLKWARAQAPPAPWDLDTCEAAAKGGHLHVLQWARAQAPPAPWDEDTCEAAAKGGHLRVLQWARAQAPPAPWDADTCAAAAQGGHRELLQWARDQGAPWDECRRL